MNRNIFLFSKVLSMTTDWSERGQLVRQQHGVSHQSTFRRLRQTQCSVNTETLRHEGKYYDQPHFRQKITNLKCGWNKPLFEMRIHGLRNPHQVRKFKLPEWEENVPHSREVLTTYWVRQNCPTQSRNFLKFDPYSIQLLPGLTIHKTTFSKDQQTDRPIKVDIELRA